MTVDIPLVIIILALVAALAVLSLFVVLVAGIRADDRIQDAHKRPRSEIKQLTRRVLLYASPQERPEGDAPCSEPEREKRR
uniref:hypothetical protein n=1 Tax=Nonomuraea pusilla TaxID=46177 RepID=UPI0006E220AA|nr:hypothetical protein [Nonomuraea pusilla]